MKIKSSDTILFLDASSVVVHIGILNDNKWIGYFRSEDPALQSLFQGVEVCLQTAGLHLSDITGFAYCEGPGSLLGIRLVAMAIRAWKEQKTFMDSMVYAYNSFDVSLELIRKIHNSKEPYAIVSQSAKGFWNFLSTDSSKIQVSEFSEAELASFSGTLWLFKQKKIHSCERNFQTLAFDYSLQQVPEIFYQGALLRPVDEPDAAFVREPEYVKWDSKRHNLNASS